MNLANSPSNRIINSRAQFLRVRAGPGTGKSFSLQGRVARLLNEGLSPQKVLVVTFTRVSALDLQGELAGLGVTGAESIRATTLHALAMRMLGLQSIRSRFPRAARIVSDFERDPLISDLMRPGRGKRDVRSMLRAYEGMWAKLQDDQPRSAKKPEERAFEEDLLDWLGFHDAMLLDELIPKLYRLLKANPDLLIANQYAHVLIDEFQDLNRAEQNLCDLVAGDAAIAVVGDEDQSIYGYKHAHPDGIRNWLDDKVDHDDVELVDCYRCPLLAVEAANALISGAPRDDRRSLVPLPEKGRGEVHVWENWMPSHEAKRVVLEIQNLLDKGVPPKDVLILTRNRRYGKEVQNQLTLSGIPAISYLSEAATPTDSVKHNLEVLTLASDVEDRVALRWLLGEGSSTWNKGRYTKFRAICKNEGMKSPWRILCEQADREAEHGVDSEVMSRFESIREEVEAVRRTQGTDAVMDMMFPREDATMADMRNIIEEEMKGRDPNEEPTLAELLLGVRRAINLPEERDKGDFVRLMTLHKSKGLSAPYTFIVGCIDGVLPKRDNTDYEEERRLMYVAASRVKADLEKGKRGVLVFTYPIRLRKGDAKALVVDGEIDVQRNGLIMSPVSPFIRELGLQTTRRFYASDGSEPILRPHD
ncbi:MAG: ATP-dependent helicase [Chloroflexi bacterium]|nr:ATP-dependent helicase [Chloroflexota bacterium]